MPTSALPKRTAKQPLPPARSRYLRPLLLLIALAVVTVVVIAMPASLVQRFLLPPLHAADFSGTFWHGSAGKVLVNAEDAGAIEWHIHPWSLLSLTLSADVHWVKIGFVANATVTADRHGATARNVVGGGPIEDLTNFGLPTGWRGTSQFKFSELKVAFDGVPIAGSALSVRSVVGDLRLADLSSTQIAAGANLGGYTLHIADGAITPDADAAAEISDTGGPLELTAAIHYSTAQHSGLLVGTVKERPQASDALRQQLQALTQMHARDPQGRIPIELEFTL